MMLDLCHFSCCFLFGEKEVRKRLVNDDSLMKIVKYHREDL